MDAAKTRLTPRESLVRGRKWSEMNLQYAIAIVSSSSSERRDVGKDTDVQIIYNDIDMKIMKIMLLPLTLVNAFFSKAWS